MTGEKAPFTRLFLDHVEAIPDPESLLFFAPRKAAASRTIENSHCLLRRKRPPPQH